MEFPLADPEFDGPFDWHVLAEREDSNSYDIWAEFLCISGKFMAVCADQVLGEAFDDEDRPAEIGGVQVVQTSRGFHFGPLEVVQDQIIKIDYTIGVKSGMKDALRALGWQTDDLEHIVMKFREIISQGK